MKMHLIEPNACAQTTPTVLLIHPMLSSAEGMKTVLVNNMGDDLRYLVPDLAAHGEEDATEYTSASQEAAQIHDWLLEHNITHLSLGFGASLGGVVLSELLKFNDLFFDHLFFEGTSFWTGGFLASTLEFMLKKVFLAKHRKAIADPELSVKKMEQLYGKVAAKPMSEHFIAMSDQSIQSIIHDCSNVDLPALSPDVQRRCIFAYGEKDFDLKRARRILPKVYPEATLTIWQSYDHCERMSSDSAAYGQMLRELAIYSTRLITP